MFRESVAIAMSGEHDAEGRVLLRLRRIAKALPATSAPLRLVKGGRSA